MKSQNPDFRNFLTGGLGYSLGALAGVLFIFLSSKLGFAGWLFGLIDQNQTFLQLLGTLLIAGFLLTLGGALMGGIGGWAMTRIVKTPQRAQLIVGSAVAYALSAALTTLLFLLLISFMGLYNNFTKNQIEHYGILFGLFGLVFGLVTGILQALMSVRLRHTWRVILANLLGFTAGGVILGLLVRLVNPTAGFQTHPILTWLALLIALMAPFFMGGGALGFVHGRIAARATDEENPVQYIFPAKWQTIIVALLGFVLVFTVLRVIDSVSGFLTINSGDLQSQIAPVTVGVQWTPAQPYTGNPDAIPFPQADQETISVAGADQTEHRAWCSSEGRIHYQRGDESPEQIEFPSCTGIPALTLDLDGQPHLVWYTQEIRDTNGVARSDNLLVESIRTATGWSEAAIAARTGSPVTPTLSTDPQGNINLVWADAAQNYWVSLQEEYQCDPADLSVLELAGIGPVLDSDMRPAGTEIPYCRNQYELIQYTPNPDPAYSQLPITEDGAFDYLSDMTADAEYEVLFTTMQYEPNNTPPSPGTVLAEKLAALYQKVKANPENYPRGMTVKVLLGNYPVVSQLGWGNQIYDAISDFRAAGVEKMVDTEIGWRLEVANFPGTYPHSHTKFVVVDGKSVAGVGYNFGYLHLPLDHPSGQGYDMLDLGLQITGPIAQDAVSVFDDMWSGADQIHCDDFHPSDGSEWTDTCQPLTGVVSHPPEVLRTYLPPTGTDHAFSIYRSKDYKEADTFVASSLAAAEKSIDMLHVNFSLEMICMVNVVFPDACTIQNTLPWLDAVIEAIEHNQVKVRVIMETSNSNGLENRVAVNVLRDELERRGLSDYVEFRFYNGKLHAKSTLIDSSMLIIGSQNMHYSSWGESGLTEYSLVTDSLEAIAEYQALFEAKWEEAVPFDEAEFGTTP